jgi:hypothetical protein
MEFTRADAEKAARNYYQSTRNEEINSNDLLDPRRIRDWALQSLKVRKRRRTSNPPSNIQVELKRDFKQTQTHIWRVLPVATENRNLNWFDPAGYLLAVSMTPEDWEESFFNDYDFILDSSRKLVTANAYL